MSRIAIAFELICILLPLCSASVLSSSLSLFLSISRVFQVYLTIYPPDSFVAYDTHTYICNYEHVLSPSSLSQCLCLCLRLLPPHMNIGIRCNPVAQSTHCTACPKQISTFNVHPVRRRPCDRRGSLRHASPSLRRTRTSISVFCPAIRSFCVRASLVLIVWRLLVCGCVSCVRPSSLRCCCSRTLVLLPQPRHDNDHDTHLLSRRRHMPSRP